MGNNTNDTDSLDEFLSTRSFSPLTGLVKLLVDLDLPEEVKLLDCDLKSQAMHGIYACYVLRSGLRPNWQKRFKEKDLARAHSILNSGGKYISPESAFAALNKVARATIGQEHRFVTLMTSYAKPRDAARSLSAMLVFEDEMLWVENRETNPRSYHKMQRDMYSARHRTISQLLGLSLAEGQLKKAREYAEEIKKIPFNSKFENGDHVNAVIEYLDLVGWKALENRIACRVGTNGYWWKHKIGHGSKMYRYAHDCKVDISTNWLTTAVYTSTFVGAGLLVKYFPEFEKFLKDAVQYLSGK